MARREYDAYDTDPVLALACASWVNKWVIGERSGGLSEVLGPPPLNILEPMAGTGPFVAASRAVWPDSKIVATDLRTVDQIGAERAKGLEAATMTKLGVDAFTLPPALLAKVDLVISNPAFTEADKLVRFLWPHLREGSSIVLLLNITFLAAQERWDDAVAKENGKGDQALYNLAPLRFCAPIIPRPSFIEVNGKAAQAKYEAGLFTWTKGWIGATSFPEPVRWEKPKRSRGPRMPKEKKGEEIEEQGHDLAGMDVEGDR